MTTIDNEIRTRQGTCAVHGRVTAEKTVPKLKFPFIVTAPARLAASMRPYRCPECGSKA